MLGQIWVRSIALLLSPHNMLWSRLRPIFFLCRDSGIWVTGSLSGVKRGASSGIRVRTLTWCFLEEKWRQQATYSRGM